MAALTETELNTRVGLVTSSSIPTHEMTMSRLFNVYPMISRRVGLNRGLTVSPCPRGSLPFARRSEMRSRHRNAFCCSWVSPAPRKLRALGAKVQERSGAQAQIPLAISQHGNTPRPAVRCTAGPGFDEVRGP